MNDILFGNNNKAVIKKLANRSFRSNKMRNVIAVIAIALTTFLFTAVLTIGMGAKGTLEYNMAKMIGTGADALVFPHLAERPRGPSRGPGGAVFPVEGTVEMCFDGSGGHAPPAARHLFPDSAERPVRLFRFPSG